MRQPHSERTLRAAPWQLPWMVLLCVLLAACFPAEVGAAESGVGRFRDLSNAKRFHEIYVTADTDFRRITSEDEWMVLLDKVRTKLGRVESSNQRAVDVVKANEIITVTLAYTTLFSEGAADEQFTFLVRSGDPILRGYRIASSLLSASRHDLVLAW